MVFLLAVLAASVKNRVYSFDLVAVNDRSKLRKKSSNSLDLTMVCFQGDRL